MKTNFLKKLFYPPQYLSMRVAGIDIGNDSIRYMEFADVRGTISIKKYGEIALPEQTFKDGEILNKTALVKALSEIRSAISADIIKVSITEETTYIFDTQIPLVKGSDLREAITFKLEENVPLKVDEISFEYDLVHAAKEDGMESVVASVSVIPKKIIENFADACALSGFAVGAFEMESRMIARSVVPKGDMRALMLINVKADSTLLVLVVSGIVRFTSTIAIGESAMKASMSKADSYGENAPDSLANVFSIIKDEIEKFNEYLFSKSEGSGILLPKSVDAIILSGKSSILPGFINHISQNLDAKVLHANVWVNAFDVNVSLPKLSFEQSLDFAGAIGLALQS